MVPSACVGFDHMSLTAAVQQVRLWDKEPATCCKLGSILTHEYMETTTDIRNELLFLHPNATAFKCGGLNISVYDSQVSVFFCFLFF